MKEMPVIFVGHGSPMNIIEDNAFTRGWVEMEMQIPKPKAILCISAHWFEEKTIISTTKKPDTIYDFYGFPDILYSIKYPSPGASALAIQVQKYLEEKNIPIGLDFERGLDHGCWSVLKFMYPKADVPVCQLSINRNFTPQQCYDLGKQLKYLRKEGVLILASGNIVHHLALIDWQLDGGFEWANQFDGDIKKALLDKRHDKIISFQNIASYTNNIFYYPDHYYPLLYALGATSYGDNVRVYNDARTMGAVSMTSYTFGN